MAVLRNWYARALGVLMLAHLSVAPYTKVEESFNMQAAHDFLEYGLPLKNAHLKLPAFFDHMEFPGSVPRTFVGSLIVSTAFKPLMLLRDFNGAQQQYGVRMALGVMNAYALEIYTRAARNAYGDRTALWYHGLQLSQFHIFYYASRTLPNMFAFGLSTLALAAVLPNPVSRISQAKRNRLCFYLLTVAAVIFRSEVALLIAAQALRMLMKADSIANRISLIRQTILPAVVAAAVAGVLITVALDTYMWQSQHFLWPELSAFLFNVFPPGDHQGASAWGVQPWYWYFTSAIPRLLLSPALLLLGWGLLYTTQTSAILDQLVPSLLYTAMYSFLPHKETRFLFPVIPQLTLSLALTVSYLSTRRQVLAKVITGLVLLSMIAAAIFSHLIMLPLSAQSYPGADALRQLQSIQVLNELQDPTIWARKFEINVYFSNLALQTGVTRFLEQPPPARVELKTKSKPDANAKPFVMPGSPDGRYPALTLNPKPTQAATVKGAKVATNPIWHYDKTEDPPLAESPETSSKNQSSSSSEIDANRFWSSFDYLVLEDPSLIAQPVIKQNFETAQTIYSLRRQAPKLLRYQPARSSTGHPYTEVNTNTLIAPIIPYTSSGQVFASYLASVMDSSLLSRHRRDARNSFTGGFPEKHTNTYIDPAGDSELSTLLYRMYGRLVADVYSIVYDFCVHGPGRKFTGGRWISWGLEPRLYILQRRTEVLGSESAEAELKTA